MRLTKDEQAAVAAAASVRPLRASEKYIVIGPYCYGFGQTVAEALKNAKANRVRSYEGKAGWRFMLFVAHKNIQVGTLGDFRWDSTVTGKGLPYQELYRTPEKKK